MVYRLKGQIQFNTNAARDTFLSELATWKEGKHVLLDKTEALGQRAVTIDIAGAVSQNTRDLFQNLKDRAKTHVDRAYLHVHKCRLEAGDENTHGNLNEFMSYTY